MVAQWWHVSRKSSPSFYKFQMVDCCRLNPMLSTDQIADFTHAHLFLSYHLIEVLHVSPWYLYYMVDQKTLRSCAAKRVFFKNKFRDFCRSNLNIRIILDYGVIQYICLFSAHGVFSNHLIK